MRQAPRTQLSTAPCALHLPGKKTVLYQTFSTAPSLQRTGGTPRSVTPRCAAVPRCLRGPAPPRAAAAGSSVRCVRASLPSLPRGSPLAPRIMSVPLKNTTLKFLVFLHILLGDCWAGLAFRVWKMNNNNKKIYYMGTRF